MRNAISLIIIIIFFSFLFGLEAKKYQIRNNDHVKYFCSR